MLAAMLLYAAHAAPDPSALRDAVGAANRHVVHALPELSDKQWSTLVGGGCVRVLAPSDDPDGPSSAVGLLLTTAPREALWIAAQDPHAVVDPDLIEFVVERRGVDAAIWYGYWDLPSPVKDRQWVVHSYNNHALATATAGAAWEHVWSLVPDGLEAARAALSASPRDNLPISHLDQAIFTPVNRGSWTMITVGEHTLLAYQASSVVGGAIPDWLVAKLVMARLEGVLRGVDDRARGWAPSHYGPQHEPVPGGDGRPLARLSPPPTTPAR